MAITKITMSGFTPSTFTKYDDFLAGNAAYDPAATWLIQRTSPTSGSSITFSSIPSTYKNLQIRGFYKDSSAATGLTYGIQLNSDTGTNYVYHTLYGDGSTVTATGAASGSNTSIRIPAGAIGTTPGSTFGGVSIIDILDYGSTSKYKTVRTFSGCDANTVNTSYRVAISSGLWISTSAITSVTIAASSGFASGTTFALYGIVG